MESKQFFKGDVIQRKGSGATGIEVAFSTSIIYGGSCKPSNAKELFSSQDIDGGLIGGASLNSDDFIAITQSF